ncbi:PREDICTED: putative E3 ubiquitin-protein ligase SH3RF2 isoform X2 [Nanorana parkeri]|uniref:putative E3 ubiquitin-protein ligase SH3RF2 isoform X2 n=1 Tax=Nanorana parkeri TaxID=125878 RepID=UPI0008549558|nr:PREDICTED: putative E3 ubiquitin-protein ligase SH3RF2 isoform X2 [Nanorana parkeri]
MDDLVVLDLLDCPVCLGKLDATAKVLPCQHTFCQPCLQRILKARKELRCPECRTPVHCSIGELPANLLLVRLLEGIKSGKGLMRKKSFQRMGGLFAQDSFRKTREQKANHESNYRLFPKNRMPLEGAPRAKAVLSHKGRSPSDLSFNKGDVIILQKKLDENCYHGEVNGGSGVIPTSSVKILKKMDPPLALCRALYNFDLKDKEKSKNKDCLKFAKDDIISVLRRVDDNWAEGRLGDQVGIFPLLFVELNSTARQLLESNKCKRKDANKMALTPSPLKRSPSNVTSESAAMRQVPEGRRKRQFLITSALNTLNKIVHSPSGRHIPEISMPILISSSNTAMIEKARFLSNTPNQASGSFYYATLGSQGTGPSLVAVPSSHHNVLANMCIAVHPYTAHGPDEIDLQKGEGIRVLGKFQEGWLRGISLVTGKIGIFPSHCVHPVSSKKPSNYPDARLPSQQTKWISSNASVSSQSSVSETGISRPVRSFHVPTAVVEPVKNTTPSSSLVPMMLLRRNSSLKKNLPLQKTIQSNSGSQPVGTITRSPSMGTQPQQIIINASHSNVGASAETRTRPNSLYDALPIFSRPVDYRRFSAASSIALEPRELITRNNSTLKSPISAPPSILVKPDTPKSGVEKVKTVRFMNFSPQTLKRQSVVFDVKDEEISSQNIMSENLRLGESTLTVPLRPNPALAHKTEGRKIQKLRSIGNDVTPIPPQSTLSFPKKRTHNDNSNRTSAIYQAQEIPST